MTTYRKGEIPDTLKFSLHQKKVQTQACRIFGPFTVETPEGPLTCVDGYLCLDARGFPYPVAADEFDLIYATAE